MTQIKNAKSAAAPNAVLSPSAALAGFRGTYRLKPMAKREENADQLTLMRSQDGMHDMPAAPANESDFPRVGAPPATSSEARKNRHLWVIRSSDMPVALEACDWGKNLESQVIKHSNLTGGLEAHSGGEIWFVAENRVAVNGASGRYGAQSEVEFGLVVDALRQCGYHVASAGFDLDNPSVANKIFIGEPDWKVPL